MSSFPAIPSPHGMEHLFMQGAGGGGRAGRRGWEGDRQSRVLATPAHTHNTGDAARVKAMAGMPTGSFRSHMPSQSPCSAPGHGLGPADHIDQQSANCREVEADGPRQEKIEFLDGTWCWAGH